MLALPRSIIITAATVAPAVLFGIVTASPSTKVSAQPLPVVTNSATQSAGMGTQSALPSRQRSVIIEQGTNTHGTSTPATNTPNTSATHQTTASTIVSNPVADPVTPVTAVSAVLSDWMAPVPDTRPNSVPGGTVLYQYCVYTYSNGSTQQRLYQAVYSRKGARWFADPAFDRTTATPPAAQ